MKYLYYLFLFITGFVKVLTADAAPLATGDDLAGKKVLIAYYSRTGTTAAVVPELQRRLQADVFRIKPMVPYPDDYQECADLVIQEHKTNERPMLKANCENVQEYDVVVLGYPIWWFEAPNLIYTFVEENRAALKGKIIVAFCSSGGTDIKVTLPGLQKALPETKILEGFTINRPMNVYEWLKKMGM